MDTGSIGESSIDERGVIVEAFTRILQDIVDGGLVGILIGELGIGEGEAAIAFDVDLIAGIDHDFGDGGVVEVLLEGGEVVFDRSGVDHLAVGRR